MYLVISVVVFFSTYFFEGRVKVSAAIGAVMATQSKENTWRETLVVKFVLWFLGHLQKKQEETGAHIALTSDQGRCDCHEVFLSHQTIQNIKYKSERIKELIREYEEFYDGWLQRVRAVERDGNGATPQMV